MIIAISGKAQSGKDTICSMIQYCIWYYNEYVKYKYQGNTIFKYTKNTEVFTEDIYQMYLQEADNE